MVNKRDLVKINIKSIYVAHGIAFPDFRISNWLEPGETVNIEFVADKSGEFDFFCNVYYGSEHSDMRGKLIVN